MLRQTIIDIFVNEDNRNREGWNPLDIQQRQNLSLQRVYSTVLHYREQTNENYISKTVYMYGIASAWIYLFEYHLCLCDCYTLTNTLLLSAIPVYPSEAFKHFGVILRGEQERVDSLCIDERLLSPSQHFSYPCCQQLEQLSSNFASNGFKIIRFLHLFMTSENSGSVLINMYRV